MAAKLSSTPAGTRGDGKPLTRDDNQTEEQKAAARAAREREAKEAAAVQLVSITHRIRQAKKKSAEAKAAYDAVKAEEVELYRLAKVSGHTRQDIDEDLRDLGMDTRKYLAKEAERSWRKEVQGLARPQAELDTAPAEKRDEVYWRLEGYRVALNFGTPQPQDHGVPPDHFAIWMEGWHDGAEALKKSLEAADAAAAAGDEDDQAPAPLAAIAEAEPELVAQIVEDHGADDFEMSEAERAAQLQRPKPVENEAV